MRLFMLIGVSMFLFGCSSTSNVIYSSPCFDTQQEAASVGNDIFNLGFNNRVSYWATGDASNSIVGLGLSYGGFDPKPYCPDGGYPILVYFDSSKSNLDTENVKNLSKIVLKAMLKERANIGKQHFPNAPDDSRAAILNGCAVLRYI